MRLRMTVTGKNDYMILYQLSVAQTVSSLSDFYPHTPLAQL